MRDADENVLDLPRSEIAVETAQRRFLSERRVGRVQPAGCIVPAPEDFDIASGHIPKGSAAALRFEVHGLVDGGDDVARIGELFRESRRRRGPAAALLGVETC